MCDEKMASLPLRLAQDLIDVWHRSSGDEVIMCEQCREEPASDMHSNLKSNVRNQRAMVYILK